LDSRGRGQGGDRHCLQRYVCGTTIAPQLGLFRGDQAVSIHMLVQFDVKSAAPEIKTGLLCVDRSHHMDETLIALKRHAASRQIQNLAGCLRCMVGRIRSMQGKLHCTQKLYLALLCLVTEPDSMAFTL